MAMLALVVGSLHLSSVEAGLVALAAALVASISDAGVARLKLPLHRRQVNERWLDQYRPWVYGVGFGWQIGAGLTTYITTAAVYLMIVLGALTGKPLAALFLGAGFGLFRGLAVFLAGRLKTPSDLRAFHRRFMAVGPAADRVVIVVELAIVGVMGGALRSAAAAIVVGIVLVATAMGRFLMSGGSRQLRTSSPMPGSDCASSRSLTTTAPGRDVALFEAQSRVLSPRRRDARPLKPPGSLSPGAEAPLSVRFDGGARSCRVGRDDGGLTRYIDCRR